MTATLFTCNGTGVDLWTGYPADIGRALAGDDPAWAGPYFELTGKTTPPPVWYWQPVGYPSAPFPMGPSVDAGVAELVRLLRDVHPSGPFAFVGYSQGALITCKVWRDHILNPNGELHHRLPDFFAHITYGNPMRAPGVANGNVYAGQPIPKNLDGAVTGGIAGKDDLTPAQTPPWQLDFANDGDLYASAPVGTDPWHHEAGAGAIETQIYNIVQKVTAGDIFAIVGDVVTILDIPKDISIVEAIVNGALFASQGLNAPHWQYNIDAAVRYLRDRVVHAVNPSPTPVPAVVTPTPNGNNVNFATILSVLKALPRLRDELVTGLVAAGSVIGTIETVAPYLPASVKGIVTGIAGVVPMLVNFLKSNLVVTIVNDISKL